MGVKRRTAARELTASQKKVVNVLQKDIIERYFQPAIDNDEFEILSTLRYDPCFTNVFESLSNCEHTSELSEIDSRLRLWDYEQSNDLFSSENIPSSGTDGALDSFFDTMKDTSSSLGDYDESLLSFLNGSEATERSSPPNASQDHDDLYLIFYNRFLLVGEHYKRLNFSLDFFRWGTHIPLKLLLDKLIEALPEHHEVTNIEQKMSLLLKETACYKMRVLISKTGRMRVEAHPLVRPPALCRLPSASSYFMNTILGAFLPDQSATWNVFVDSKPMSVSPFTTFKTTYRDHYNAARDRLKEMASGFGQNSFSEILVFNDANQLMEGSITNVAVIKHKDDDKSKFRFVTPPLASGCLCGTMRYYLLKKGLIDEYPIDIRDVKEGDNVILFNGVMGCVKGIIKKGIK